MRRPGRGGRARGGFRDLSSVVETGVAKVFVALKKLRAVGGGPWGLSPRLGATGPKGSSQVSPPPVLEVSSRSNTGSGSDATGARPGQRGDRSWTGGMWEGIELQMVGSD